MSITRNTWRVLAARAAFVLWAVAGVGLAVAAALCFAAVDEGWNGPILWISGGSVLAGIVAQSVVTRSRKRRLAVDSAPHV